MRALLERLKNSFPGRLAKAYGESKAGNYAAGLAFNAFMTRFRAAEQQVSGPQAS
jgi:hypothetical protein